jgi:hypothetical protein
MKRTDIEQFVNKYNQVEVTFIKTDGSQREMLGTRKRELIPDSAWPKDKPEDSEKKKPEPNPAIVKIYDLEAEGWRCFKIEKVVHLIGMNDKGEVMEIIDTFEDETDRACPF